MISSTGVQNPFFPLRGRGVGGDVALVSRPQLCLRRKLIFCQLDSASDGSFRGKTPPHVIDNFPHLPDTDRPLPATPQRGRSDSRSLRAVLRVSVPGPSGTLPPHILYLLELGFDLKQIKVMARKYPAFANYSLEGNIRPLIEFLLDLGVSRSDFPNILKKCPQLFGLRLRENLIPSLEVLETIGMDKSKWRKLIYRFPCFLVYSRNKVKAIVEFLIELGLSEENIGLILTRSPQIVCYRVEEKLRPSVEYFQSLGVDVARLLRHCPQIINLSLETNLKPHTEFFLENGFSIEELVTMISKFGALYSSSLNGDLVAKWELFLTMDYTRQDLVKFPQYFGYSLEKRIKPRYKLMNEYEVKISLNQLLSTPDDRFGVLLEKRTKNLQLDRPQLCLRRKVISCQPDSALDGSFRGETPSHVIDNFPHLPDTGRPLPATPQHGRSDSRSLRAVLRVSVPGSSGTLPPHILYLLELGFDLKQIKVMAGKYPAFANYSLEGNIRPLIEFLLDLGVSRSDIPNILKKCPQLFGMTLPEDLSPSLAFLETLGVDKSKWPKVIFRSPIFLSISRKKVEATVEFLFELGLSEEDTGKILTRCPQIVGHSVEEKLRPSVEYLQSLGVDAARLLRRCPQIMNLSLETNLKPFTEFFLENGFSIEEFGLMVNKFGALYASSLKGDLVAKWELFLKMDYPRQDLVKFPQYFSYSYEERIKPRYNLMKESGVELPLNQLLNTTDDRFGVLLQKRIEKLQSDK